MTERPMSAAWRERIKLPSEEQVREMTDVAALRELSDKIDGIIATIETDLKFRDDLDGNWRGKALSAMKLHLSANRLIAKRLRFLAPKVNVAPKGSVRPDDENSETTNAILRDGLPAFDPAVLRCVDDVDAASAAIGAMIVEIERDLADENAAPDVDRDPVFVAWAKGVLREMRVRRATLSARRGELSRAARSRALAVRSSTREQLFIDAAREALTKEQFDELWRRVDSIQAATSESEAA